ncbi:sperm-associated antigen 5 isoform X2 [Sander lucioperca]|uniref:sperm-associated antigen 5 isoform X2 n=1 Tax=Sander lucioperca TaxID=283035 RepID=UPI00125CDF39|nr:sperm-associated antigen 5 isoform X2 [Sander lucioperca]
MSSRKSHSSGEGLPSSKFGERTPLRSLQNEMLHLSTPSRFKSKSLLNADVVKLTMGDVPLCDPEPLLQSPPSTKVIQINASPIDTTTTEIACGLGDVTLKSFVCPGGEVEVTGSSVCAEESIILPNDQAMKNMQETEDTVLSDTIIVQSCSDHIDHPYYNPEMKDASLIDVDAACLCEISNSKLTPEDLDNEHATQDFRAFQNNCFEEKDVTWKSFVCDGGEVEVSDVTRLQEETIALPKAQLGEPLQNSVNLTNLSDCGQLCQVEHTDHLYFSSENGVCVITTFSDTTNTPEKPADGLSNATFKSKPSFNCSGGVISGGTKLADEAVSLPADQTATCSLSYNYGIEPSMFASDQYVQNNNDHSDHPHCNIENYPLGEPLPFSLDVVDEDKPISLVVQDCQTGGQAENTFTSFISAGRDIEMPNGTRLSQKMFPLPDDQAVICQPLDDNGVPTSLTQDHIQDDYEKPNSHVENEEVVVATGPPAIGTSSLTNTSLKALDDKSVKCQMQETSKKDLMHHVDSALPTMLYRIESSDSSQLAASAEIPTLVEVHEEHVSQVQISSEPHKSSEDKDCALGSPGIGPILCNSAEKPRPENLPNVLKVLSECPSVASGLPFGILSPIVRRASLAVLKAFKGPAFDQFLADDSALKGGTSFLAGPFLNLDQPGLLGEHLVSPMPRPLFNSTALDCKPQPDPVTESVDVCAKPCAVSQSDPVIEPVDDVCAKPCAVSQPDPVTEPVEDLGAKPCAVPQTEVEVLDMPMIPDGSLQQQLRQMAEFLFLASGKMGPAAISNTVLHPAAVTVPPAEATPAESHSVCVGTTPVKWLDHSVNTSGQFEQKRDFSVVDSCTLTDPLLWNLPPGGLEGLPRKELEQGLRSSMITVEALVQQLAAARANGCSSAGPAPSDLREKLVQTDHTELSQTTMYRDLYLEALNRVGDLEMDDSSLQNLTQCMQDTRVTMTSLSCDTDAALSNMKQMGDSVREDHQSLVLHYDQMKTLLKKTKEIQTTMMQKVKDSLLQRDDMMIQMEEAFRVKEAAFSAMEQLRTHCATEISELERIVGSQQELSAALDQTYPQQVALNQACTEMLNSASDVLSTTMEEQSSLMKELCKVRGLMQKTAPMLLKLNKKAAAALRERDEHMSARNQAVEEREQIEEELNHAYVNLQTAREQIGDLNLQGTILTSEMGVLRQKLTEREEERGPLERKVTELSATVSSTLASYAFLEQALGAETTKLKQSWKDIQLAKDRANELQTSLGQSEQRVHELSRALAQTEEQLSQLQVLSQSQNLQIQQLQDVCTQLGGVREMNEFLQMENELAREQVVESERMVMTNLQALRERNIQCEDLKGELGQFQLENRSLHKELETTKSRASATQLELGEKLAQAVTEITLLHHTLRGLTNELNAALNDQKPEPQKDKESHAVHTVERRHPSGSFVDSIMVALTAEKEEDASTETPPGSVPSDMAEPLCETLFSETSAFTRIAVTPKKNFGAVESEPEEEDQSSMAELFAGLGSTVTELLSTLKLLRQHKDAQLEELHNTISGLQVEQQAANNRHEAEVFELKHQLSRLNSLFERGNQALQQKAQDEKMVTKLMAEIQETQETLIKHKTDSNELRKEVVELRRSLQQSKVESQFLREELMKAGSQSANPAHFMEEKIQLLREVERLKLSLQEGEQARVKLLDRAKRHQMIHQTNQQKSENELQMLNKVINKVREALLSLPVVVKNCEQLQQLIEYIG